MKIVPFEKTHQVAIQNLILDIQTQEFDIAIDLKSQSDLGDIENYYQKNNGNFWVAIEKDEIVGTISLLDIGNNQGALRKMFVKKGLRGRELGVGQQLLNTLLNWAKNKMISEIYLGTTEKFVAAHRFYEKNSFTEIKKTELPQNFPIMKVDVKFYKFTYY